MIEKIIIVVLILISWIAVNLGCGCDAIKVGGGQHRKHEQRIKSYDEIAADHKQIVALLDRPETGEVIRNAKTCRVLSDIEHRLPYMPSRNIPKTTTHNGQIKLFLTELMYMTQCLPTKDSEAIFIYAGSSPSNKLPYLAGLFPRAKFVLVDPNEHYLMYGDTDQYNDEHIDKMLYFVAGANKGTGPGNNQRKHKSRVRNQLVNMYGVGRTSRNESALKGSPPDNLAEIIESTGYTYYVIEDIYTDRISELLSKLSDHRGVFFLSDIRTSPSDEEEPSDFDIVVNSAMMYNWINILRPAKYMLKFHPPYDLSAKGHAEYKSALKKSGHFGEIIKSSGIDFESVYRTKMFPYFSGDIWLQAFAPNASSESRLIGDCPIDRNVPIVLHDHDCLEYDDKFFYYNRIHRSYGWHTQHEDCLNSAMGIDRCGDCAMMMDIFNDYCVKYGIADAGASTRTKMYNDLTTMIDRSVLDFKSVHGGYFVQYTGVDEVLKYILAFYRANVSLDIMNPRNMYKKPITTDRISKSYAVANFLETKNVPSIMMRSAQLLDLYNSEVPFRYMFTILCVELKISNAQLLLNGCLKAHQSAHVMSGLDLGEMFISRRNNISTATITTINNVISKVVKNVKKYYKLNKSVGFISIGSDDIYDETRSVYPGPAIIYGIDTNCLIVSDLGDIYEEYKFIFNTNLIKQYPNNKIICVDVSMGEPGDISINDRMFNYQEVVDGASVRLRLINVGMEAVK
jgi:hypothetical protein